MREWHDAQIGFDRCFSICCAQGRRPCRPRLRRAAARSAAAEAAASRGCSAGCTCRGSRPTSASDSSTRPARCPGSESPPRCSVVRSTRRNSDPVHAVDAVVVGQELVQVRVARVEELADRPVVVQDRVEEHARFGLHRVAQFGAPCRELLRVRLDAVQVPDLEPLARRSSPPGPRPWDRPACASPARRAPAASSTAAAPPGRAAGRPASSSRGSSSAATPARRPRPGARRSGRSGWGRARCGTGSAARRASPESPGRGPVRWSAPSALASATNFVSSATSAWVTGRRYARRASVDRILSTQTAPVFGSQTRTFARLGFGSVGRERPDDRHRPDPLVDRVLVDVGLLERLHERRRR